MSLLEQIWNWLQTQRFNQEKLPLSKGRSHSGVDPALDRDIENLLQRFPYLFRPYLGPGSPGDPYNGLKGYGKGFHGEGDFGINTPGIPGTFSPEPMLPYSPPSRPTPKTKPISL